MQIICNSDYKILKYIYRHPYITTSELLKSFQPQNSDVFKMRLHFLWSENYISNRVYSNDRDYDATEQRGNFDVSHFVVLPQACVIIEERRRNFISFIVPYAITTLIAIASLVTNLIAILR